MSEFINVQLAKSTFEWEVLSRQYLQQIDANAELLERVFILFDPVDMRLKSTWFSVCV